MNRLPLPFGWLLLVLFSVVIHSAFVAGWEHVQDGEALERAIAGGDDVLVAFIDDQPKSASFESEWLSAVSEGKESVVSIDCVANKAACDQHQVAAFPSIVLFESGKAVSQYYGPRRAAAILQFIARRKLPMVSEGLTLESLEVFKSADDVAFVAFLDPQDSASTKAFSEVASRYRDEFRFGTVTDPAVAESQDVKVPAVVCYRSVDGDKLVRNFESDKLDNWVKESSRPVLGDLTVLNRQRLLDRAWPMVYLFAPTEIERQELRKQVYKFAKGYYDSLTSVVVDPLEFPELMSKMGLEEGHFPAGAVHQIFKDHIYPYPKDKPLTPSAIQSWGLDVYQGRIKPWTPPGVTTRYEDLGPTKVATRKVSIRSIPGIKIKISGHDEL